MHEPIIQLAMNRATAELILRGLASLPYAQVHTLYPQLEAEIARQSAPQDAPQDAQGAMAPDAAPPPATLGNGTGAGAGGLDWS